MSEKSKPNCLAVPFLTTVCLRVIHKDQGYCPLQEGYEHLSKMCSLLILARGILKFYKEKDFKKTSTRDLSRRILPKLVK